MGNRPVILVGFSTDKRDWLSAVVRWATWWRHSHVVLIAPNADYFIESMHGKGVVGGHLTEFMDRDGCELRCIPHPDPQAVWDKATSQIGKPYDWRYILGWAFGRDWSDPAAWSCSELIAWAADLFPLDFAGRITPRDIYMLSKPLPPERIAP